QEEDVILAASDGVIDYFGTKLSDTRWDKETALVKYLSDKNKTIEQKAQAVIKRDNRNGGGDNLSLILIEIGGEKDV
ncbi:MAG: hypothetical protein IKV59_07945, partial [Lachnospiraceae bacterium]|nr:hypothetical protein [Lachnospiraceae bacterium]